MKKLKSLAIALLIILSANGKNLSDTTGPMPDSSLFKTETGTVVLQGGIATIHVPQGYKFLNPKGSEFLIEKIWNNPHQEGVLGMLFQTTDSGNLSSWGFVIQFESMGYVKDEDADKIDYDDLLKTMKEDAKAENKERIKAGYGSVEIIGWASTPFYDKSKKALHWARELKFSDTGEHTLNYNIRLLGRKGVLSLNAVGVMSEMEVIKKAIDPIIAATEFNAGNKYSDFKPDVDNVAAWTIGGLVAGKILAKVGFFALLLKFWKIIAVAVVGGFSWFFRRFRRKKEEGEMTDSGTENMDNSEGEQAALPPAENPNSVDNP